MSGDWVGGRSYSKGVHLSLPGEGGKEGKRHPSGVYMAEGRDSPTGEQALQRGAQGPHKADFALQPAFPDPTPVAQAAMKPAIHLLGTLGRTGAAAAAAG